MPLVLNRSQQVVHSFRHRINIPSRAKLNRIEKIGGKAQAGAEHGHEKWLGFKRIKFDVSAHSAAQRGESSCRQVSFVVKFIYKYVEQVIFAIILSEC